MNVCVSDIANKWVPFISVVLFILSDAKYQRKKIANAIAHCERALTRNTVLIFILEVKPVPAPRRLPELHDVPYDTPPSSNSGQFIEETEAIYENTNSKKSTETGTPLVVILACDQFTCQTFKDS